MVAFIPVTEESPIYSYIFENPNVYEEFMAPTVNRIMKGREKYPRYDRNRQYDTFYKVAKNIVEYYMAKHGEIHDIKTLAWDLNNYCHEIYV